MMLSAWMIALMGLNASSGLVRGDDLAPPVRLEAGGKPIDTEVGHAAPFVYDWDGDGVRDLLVGQFGGGVLWIFRNEGTNAQPRLAAGVKFKQGAKDGTVPSG
jgi:hypothetical protein